MADDVRASPEGPDTCRPSVYHLAPERSTLADLAGVLSHVHHPWYNSGMASPAATAADLLRLRAALVAHLIAELDTLDPRSLDGIEHVHTARRVIALRRGALHTELTSVCAVLAGATS